MNSSNNDSGRKLTYSDYEVNTPVVSDIVRASKTDENIPN